MKVGDVVRLKSGSPPLVVVEIREGQGRTGVVAQWWNGGGFSASMWPPECLLLEAEWRALHPQMDVVHGVPIAPRRGEDTGH